MYSRSRQILGDTWHNWLRCLGAGLGGMCSTPAQLALASDLPPVIEVRVPNGNADAAALIQEAVDRAASSHATVKLPAGRYLLARSVVIPGGMGLQGDAKGTTLAPLGTNASNPVLLHFPVGTSTVSVSHLVFDGGGIDFTNSSPLVTATGANDIVLDGVTVCNSRGVGLLLQGGMRNSGVQHSRFLNLGNHWKTTLNKEDRIQGLIFCCGESNVNNFATDNYFQDIGLDALQIGDQTHFFAASNVFELANRQFQLLPAPDYPAGIFALHSAEVVMVHNVIHHAAGNGIDAPGLQNSCISNNVVSGCGGCGIGLFLGYDGQRQSQGVIVVGNTVTDNVHWPLSSFIGGITIAGGTPRDLRIAGNTVTDTQAEKTQAYGIQVRAKTQVTRLIIERDNHLAGNRLGEMIGTGEGSHPAVDASTLHKKVLCGYQGWFRAGRAWDHWSRNWALPPQTNGANDAVFDLWPDMREYTHSYPVPGYTLPGNAPACLYDSTDPQTVETHFNWMQDYGIDGVALQRFVVSLGRPASATVLANVRAAANRTGRVFALEYDMTAATPNTLFRQLTNDWISLDQQQAITSDQRYLHHNGKPVLFLFGFYPDRFVTNPALPRQIVTWFKTNPVVPVTLIGSGEWEWNSETAAGWSELFTNLDGYMPWNTGNFSYAGTNRYATTAYWATDLQMAAKAGLFYLPELYPGFSWDNMQQLTPGSSKIDRLGGDFLWRQFCAVKQLGLDSAFVGMFDEVNEGTAIYKVSNTPPTQEHFVTYDGYPSDWYLRLTGEGARMLAGERPTTVNIPISP